MPPPDLPLVRVQLLDRGMVVKPEWTFDFEAKNLKDLNEELAKKLEKIKGRQIKVDRFVYFIKGQQLASDAEFWFHVETNRDPSFNRESEEVFLENNVSNTSQKTSQQTARLRDHSAVRRPDSVVVCLLRYQVFIQILKYPRTRFDIWLSSGQKIPTNVLMTKFSTRLKELAKSLHYITCQKHIIAAVEDEEASVTETSVTETSVTESVTETNMSDKVNSSTSESHSNLRQRTTGGAKFATAGGASSSSTAHYSNVDGTIEGSNVENTPNTEGSSSGEEIPSVKASILESGNDVTNVEGSHSSRSLTPSSFQRRLLDPTDSYTPIHEDTLILVPRYQFAWKIAYSIIQVFYFIYSFFYSFFIRGRYVPNPQLGANEAFNEAERRGAEHDRVRHRVNVGQFGQEYRHHRYAPGQNPRGEDLTLILRQGLLGL